MSKRWITAVVATVIVGGTLGFVLSEALQPEGDTAQQQPAGSPASPAAPALANAAAPATPPAAEGRTQAQPSASTPAAAQVTLWQAASLQEEETDGIVRHLTQLDPQQLTTLHTGQVVALALPGRQHPVRARLGETRNTAGSAVWHGALLDGDAMESMTLVRGTLETHITLATLDGSLSIIVDNATGKTVITDENQLVLRADPNDHLHYQHKELPPLPPPAQG
ncbi:hypothetical protein [Ectopseudomonas guguanensis]|uniref:hypothetical protein n=1 Tax=Ectopseudomonas guguanensis TaxID=1198456 RepID=UPI0028A87590|nr:hypothetical protein [Pseudomonas guguanensis]